jgi:hypothetical protein
MMKKNLLLLGFLLMGLHSFEQITEAVKSADTVKKPQGPPFIYRRDFKTIRDQSEDRMSELSYNKLIIKFLNNDSTLTNAQVLALMIGFTENPHFKPVDIMATELDIYDLSKASDFKAVVEKARPFLQTVPLSMLVLRETAIAYNRLGEKDSSRYFAALHDRIMDAMIYSGKGKKPDEAIFSLGLADGEYFVANIGYYLDKKDTQWDKYGNFMEVIDTYNDQDVKSTLYFVIQHAKDKLDDDQPDAMDAKRDKKAKKKEKENKKKKEKTESVAPPQEN